MIRGSSVRPGSVGLAGPGAGRPRRRGQQVSDAALKDRVAQLVERLDRPRSRPGRRPRRPWSTSGPRVLPLLPAAVDKPRRPTSPSGSSGSARRSARRTSRPTSGASKVTIKGKGIRLTEAIKKLQAQTGNVDHRPPRGNGAEATNPALDLDIVDKPFFEALDIVAEKAGVTLTFFTGDGTIGLMAGGMAAQPGSRR